MSCCIFNKRIVQGFSFVGSSQNIRFSDIPGFICTMSITSSKIYNFELYKVSYVLCVVNLLLLIKRPVSKV
jgi:hypothetical protein